jgi:hypothetical protein
VCEKIFYAAAVWWRIIAVRYGIKQHTPEKDTERRWNFIWSGLPSMLLKLRGSIPPSTNGGMRRVFALSRRAFTRNFLLSEILGLLHARSLNDDEDENYALPPTNNNQPFSTSNYVMVVIEWRRVVSVFCAQRRYGGFEFTK